MRDDDEIERRLRGRFTRRMLLLGAGQAALTAVLAKRLHTLQIVEGENYAFLSDTNRINDLPLAPLRGRILDRNGRELAGNRIDQIVQIVPDLARELDVVLERLRAFIPISAREAAEIMQRARRQSRILPIALDHVIDRDVLAQLSLAAPSLPGVEIAERQRRVYSGGRDFGHLVGYIGAVDRFAPGDPPELRLPGMREGKTGIEGGLDKRLRGSGGNLRREVNARGQIVRQIARRAPLGGENIRLTIDPFLQAKAMDHVHRFRRASTVVMDIASGEVRAMASSPAYDPADLTDRITTKAWRALQSDPERPLVNRAVQGLYPPGSTFKMITALAALEAGLVTPRERVTCRGSHHFAGHDFGCWKRSGHGRVNLHRAIRESCDVYFYRLAERVGIERLAAMARRFGLGAPLDVGLAGEKGGIIPDRAWKLFTLERAWLPGETLLAAIGQGYVLSTPLQLATMTARLASGREVVPSLIMPDGAVSWDAAGGNAAGAVAPDGQGRRAFADLGIDPRWMRAIRRGMVAAVNERSGTGHRAAVNWPGVVHAGKTGTSQVSRASRTRSNRALPYRLRDHALFVGYAPAAAPRFAIATIVDHGGGGGEAAAPLARRVMMDALQTRDQPQETAQERKIKGAATTVAGAPARRRTQ
ncbi:MAG: penicillin-binding protein 2 [Pseudomonadota bacterium]